MNTLPSMIRAGCISRQLRVRYTLLTPCLGARCFSTRKAHNNASALNRLVDRIEIPSPISHRQKKYVLSDTDSEGVLVSAREKVRRDTERKITSLYEAHKYKEATEKFISLKKSGIRPSRTAYFTLINICEKLGDLEAAKKIIDGQSTLLSEGQVVWSMLKLHLMHAEYNEVYELLKQHKRKGGMLKPAFYNAIMNSAIESRETYHAFQAMKAMGEAAVEPNTSTWTLQFTAAKEEKPPRNLHRTETIWETYGNLNADHEPTVFTAYIQSLVQCGAIVKARNELMTTLKTNLRTDISMLTRIPRNQSLDLPTEDVQFLINLGPSSLTSVLNSIPSKRPLTEEVLNDAYVLANLGQYVFNGGTQTTVVATKALHLLKVDNIDKHTAGTYAGAAIGRFFRTCVLISAYLYHPNNIRLFNNLSASSSSAPSFRYFAETDWWIHRPSDATSIPIATLVSLLRMYIRAGKHHKGTSFLPPLTSDLLDEFGSHALAMGTTNRDDEVEFWITMLKARHHIHMQNVLPDDPALQPGLYENVNQSEYDIARSAGVRAMLKQVQWLSGFAEGKGNGQSLVGIEVLTQQYAMLMHNIHSLNRSYVNDRTVEAVGWFVIEHMSPSTVNMKHIYGSYMKMLAGDVLSEYKQVIDIFQAHRQQPLWLLSSQVTCLRAVIEACGKMCKHDKHYARVAVQQAYPMLMKSMGRREGKCLLDANTATNMIRCCSILKADDLAISIYCGVPEIQQVDPLLLKEVLKVVSKRPNVDATLQWLLPPEWTYNLSVKCAVANFYVRHYRLEDAQSLLGEIRREAAVGSPRNKRRFITWQEMIITSLLKTGRDTEAVEQLEWYGDRWPAYGRKLSSEAHMRVCADVRDDPALFERAAAVLERQHPECMEDTVEKSNVGSSSNYGTRVS
eukprot:CFRG5952T1